MVKRTCRLCGGEFEGRMNTLYCPECKIVTCPICGKRFEPTPAKFTRYVKHGFLTCGDEECRRQIMIRRGHWRDLRKL